MNLDNLSGLDRTAILLMSLGEQAAARVFGELGDEEIHQITRSMAAIDHIPLSIINGVLQQFQDDRQKMAGIFLKGNEFARKSIRATDAGGRTETLLNQHISDVESRPFGFIATINPQLVAEALAHEHPQAIALILSTQEPAHGSAIISCLPEDAQAEIVKRMAALEQVSIKVITGLEEFLKEELGSVSTEQQKEIDGFEKAVQILRNLKHEQNSAILDQIDQQDSELARTMRSKMFTFEGLVDLEDHILQSLLREVSNDSLTVALKTGSEELKNKIFTNLSPRAAQMIREDLETIGPVRLKEVEAIQLSIAKRALKLKEEIGRQTRNGKRDEAL